MFTQTQIDSKLTKIKGWYHINYPLCVFCGHNTRGRGDLAHLIRRSDSRELQTVKLNTGLAHRDCHDIFDNKPDQAVYLPRILEVLYIIWTLDRQYFYRISGNFEQLKEVFTRFHEVTPPDPFQHHGQLLQLQYLIA